MHRFVLSIVTVCALATNSALAIDFNQVITEGTVGTGDNAAMIVIDWKSGTTPSHAWLFQWDGSASVADGYNAIAAAFPTFTWSNAPFVAELDYHNGVDHHTANAAGWLSFWNSADGINWQTNDVGVFDQMLVDGGWSGANADGIEGNWPGDAPAVPLIPEPTSLMLLGLGGLAVLARRRG